MTGDDTIPELSAEHDGILLNVRVGVEVQELPAYTDIQSNDQIPKPQKYTELPASEPPAYSYRVICEASSEILPEHIDGSRQTSRGIFAGHAGWRAALNGFSMISWALVATGCFILYHTKSEFNQPSSVGLATTLFTGDCMVIQNNRKWVHLVIAVFSATMLSAAGYAAHVLTSPTRNEVHVAHRQKRHLEIGILSLKNLLHISWSRWIGAIVSIICGICIPVLYNASFYTTFVSLDYNVGLVSESFFDHRPTYGKDGGGSAFSLVDWRLSSKMIEKADYEVFPFMSNPKRPGLSSWKNLTTEECLLVYSEDFVGSYQNVLAVTNIEHRRNESNLIGFAVHKTQPLTRSRLWQCGTYSCQPVSIDSNLWTLGRFRTPVSYCLAEPVKVRKCRIEASKPILAAATSLTAILSLAMSCLVFFQRRVLFATQGDAIASFLDNPDPSTVGMCTLTNSSFSPWDSNAYPRQWYDRMVFVATIPSKGSWHFFHWTTTICLLGGIFQYYFVAFQTEDSVLTQFRLGLGHVGYHSMIDFLSTTSASAKNAIHSLPVQLILAALPHALVAALWLLSLLPLLASMCVARELSTYAHTRQGLRVTHPAIGSQRCTKNLSIPARLSALLFISITQITIVLSQALFVARVEFLDRDLLPKNQYHAVHWNSPAILILFTLILPVMVLPTVIGWGVLIEEGPVAGTCSAVLAASAHPGFGEEQEVGRGTKEVKWGVCQSEMGGIGHLGFSSRKAASVVESGKLFY